MASFKIALLTMCLLSFASCSPVTINDSPIKISVPEACQGRDFCSERPDNYDEIQARINQLIPKDMLKEMQHRDGNKNLITYTKEEDWHNCPAMEMVEAPIFAQSPTDETKYDVVVQLEEKYEQTFLAIRCPTNLIEKISNKNQNRQCFPDLFSKQESNSGMISTCEQMHSERQLYIYDEDSNKLIMRPYKIPVHCSCILDREF